MNRRPRNAKRPGGFRALAAVVETTSMDTSIIASNYLECQPPTAEELKRKIAHHLARAKRFAALANVAWTFGDPVNERKMLRARWAEMRLADAARRVLLGIGEASK
jgi:hypothetical protein